MHKIYTTVVSICLFATASGQIFKKKVETPPSPLDSIKITEHFSYETLDTVYTVLKRNYNLNLTWDTFYCRNHYFSYWFMETPATLAIEITTRNQELGWNEDHFHRLTIISQHKRNESDTPVAQVKYAGEPVKKNFTLSGKVTDFITGEPLPYATVRIPSSDKVVTSNAEGYFTLMNVPSDTATITGNFMGYREREFYLNPKMLTQNFLLELVPEGNMLNEALVTADREDVMQMNPRDLNLIKMSPAKIASLPNVGEKDVMRSFQLMPGVSGSNESSSGLYVRGGTPDQNLVIYDGFTIYQVDHLYGFFSAFNSNALKDIQLYKGGFEAKYGGRLSSVVELTGKEGNQRKFNLGGDISLLSANLFTEIPITENLNLVMAGRKSWKGPIYNLIFNRFNSSATTTESENQNTNRRFGTQQSRISSYFYDANARLTFHPTEKDNISLSFYNGTDNLDNSGSFGGGGGGFGGFNSSNTDLTEYGNLGASLKWSRKWSDKLYNNTIISYSNYYSTRDRTNERTVTDTATYETTTTYTGIIEDNDLKDLSVKTDFELKLAESNQLEFGLFATDYHIVYSYDQNDSNILLRDNKGILSGAYLQDKAYFFKDKLEIKPGIRLSYYDPTAGFYYEPRLAASYKVSHDLTLSASTGKYYQFANRITREDILSGSRDFWVLADGNTLPVSSAIHYIAGASYDTKNYLFTANVYYKKLYDVSEYSLRFSSNFNSATYHENFYSGYGFAKGIELMAQKKVGKLTGWICYTLGQTRNHFDVYGEGYYPANQDVKNEFKAVGIYKWHKWDFSATWIYATGKPYTAPGGAYSIDLLDGTTNSYFTVTSKNTLRLPNYHRMDLAANYHLITDTGHDVGTIGISIFNAYNRTNVWYKTFELVDGEVVETNVNYLGLTPNITLSLKIR